MKLNNKGFAISTVMYMILIMAVVLISLILAVLSSRKLVLDKIKDETLNDIYVQKSVSFSNDSWETIAANVRAGNLDNYNVGDTKEVTLKGELSGTYTVRIANKSTPEECNDEKFSQTACGFVVEFVDIITTYVMNQAGEYKTVNYDNGWNIDGYPATLMNQYLKKDIIDYLPDDLKKEIKYTKVISSHGSLDEKNFESTDKLYLLSTKEVWGKEGTTNMVRYDTAESETRQLDYYKNVAKVTTDSSSGAIKKYNGNASYWWLRSAYSDSDNFFYVVYSDGGNSYSSANHSAGISPAFRIG